MKTALTILINLIASANPFLVATFGVVAAALAGITYLNAVWANLFSRLSSLTVAAGGAIDFAPFTLVNYFFPLDTFCTLLSAYLVVSLATAAIRMVKSFVPSIA